MEDTGIGFPTSLEKKGSLKELIVRCDYLPLWKVVRTVSQLVC